MVRINKLKAWLVKHNIEAVIIDNPVDLLYLTGLNLSLGRLFVSSSKSCLFVDGRYIALAKSQASCEVLPVEECSFFGAKKVAFDSAFVSYEGHQELLKNFPGIQWIPIVRPLKTLRVFKDPQEIKLLRRAQGLTREGYDHLVSLLKEGVTEEELGLEFEFFCRKKGASGLSFPSIVAFGENSAFPHHRAGKTVLKKNQIVLLDLGAMVGGYAGDMTRVVFFGTPDPQLQKDYELIQRAQKKAIAMVAPGVRFGELDKIVRGVLEKEGCGKLFSHGLSHGVGLDVHEYPRLKIDGGDCDLVLEPGMAFTVEPGIYRVGLGGVRYEDVVLVTQEGHETF